VRMKPESRKAIILTAALAAAEELGLYCLTRAEVARRAGCSTGLVSFYFEDLEGEVVRAAIAREVLPVVAFAVVTKHPAAWGCPAGLAERAVRLL